MKRRSQIVCFTVAGLLSAAFSLAQTTLYAPGSVAQSSTNYVGIGKSNPAVALDIVGGLALTSHIEMANGMYVFGRTPAGYEKAMIGSSGSYNLEIGDGSGWGNIVFYPGGPEAMRITQGGKVGIGTARPIDKLQIDESAAAISYNMGADTLYGALNIRSSRGIDDYGGLNAAYASINLATQGPATTGDSNNHTVGDLRFALKNTSGAASMTDVLTLRYNGNIGIGTNRPTARLEVIGGASSFGLIVEGDGVSANARIALRRANDSGPTGNLDWIGNTNAIGARIGVNDDVPGAMQFKLGGGTAADTKLTITSVGNVGIGTTAPTHKLAVNGAVRAREVIVDTDWSDYVFADDYRLAPLSEVEQSIKTERHLPGIPSAAEVAKDGISVGDMQARLLAKIEELTLHQIEQEKRIEAQEAEIAALKAKPLH